MGRSKAEVLGFLGLAHRAGFVVSGTQPVRQAVRDGRAAFVVIAADAALGQRRKLEGLLRHREVSSRVWASREELGRAVGSPPLSAIALTDGGFARGFEAKLGALGGPEKGLDNEGDDERYAG